MPISLGFVAEKAGDAVKSAAMAPVCAMKRRLSMFQVLHFGIVFKFSLVPPQFPLVKSHSLLRARFSC
jgi:hypothetical protein